MISVFLLIFLWLPSIKTSKINKSKEGLEWPITGPWILELVHGSNDKVSAAVKQIVNSAKITDSLSHSIVNFIVVEGATEKDLLSIPGVIDIHPNFNVKLDANPNGNWGLDRCDQVSLPLDERPYESFYKGRGVDIYSIDSGCDTDHSQFSAVPGVTREVKNIFDAYAPITSNNDKNGHGTHTMGIAAGKTYGYAPYANVYCLKVLDDRNQAVTTSNLVKSMTVVKDRHTTGKRSIVNLSLGNKCAKDRCQNDLVIQTVDKLVDAGIVVTAAAGNERTDAGNSYPAASQKAITVAASSRNDNLADFSNYGDVVNIIAPGDGIESACSSLVSRVVNNNNNYYF